MAIVMPTDLGSATLEHWVAATIRLDAAGYEMILFESARADDPLDCLAIAAAVAPLTRRIGLCATVDITTVEPFTFARGLATLDHLSGGRASWRCVGETDAARSREFAVVVAALLTSWDKGALVERHGDGILSDADAVRPIDHKGLFFYSRGPLNMPQPPQAVPPLIAVHDDAVVPMVDLLLEQDMLLRCSIEEAADLPTIRPTAEMALLVERLGIAR